MDVTDPREAYDDLVETRSREVLAPEAFARTAASEAATRGWVAFGYVFDEAGRVLLVDQPWADGWLAPGGTLEPGESLAGTFAREVAEETGVAVSPVQPHAVDEYTVVNEGTGETDGWTAVLFEGTADSVAIDDEPGLPDEQIDDARWFDGLPEDLFRPELTERVYRRCLEAGAPR